MDNWDLLDSRTKYLANEEKQGYEPTYRSTETIRMIDYYGETFNHVV